jgi:hypothetical protein
MLLWNCYRNKYLIVLPFFQVRAIFENYTKTIGLYGLLILSLMPVFIILLQSDIENWF